ncbi:MAG: TMEM14 family protein [Candidatus Melainabacteria bacterium]|nr:TMEM14 family protein [Candidatus Melainabacteria bacterium]
MNDPLSIIPVVSQYSLLVAAILVAAGGIMGFVKAGSQASLIAGLASGALAAIAFGLTFMDMKIGLIVGFAVMLSLELIFAMRLKKTGKFMPSGVMLLVCSFVQVLVLLGLLKVFQVF